MVVIGLTGSIGMGKSTVAGFFKKLAVPVFDADQSVHEMMAVGGRAVAAVAKVFPKAAAIDDKGEALIDRSLLGREVFKDEAAKTELEAIIHPLVKEARREFIDACQKKKSPFVILDIPLLFEKGGDKECDYVLVVTAPFDVQKARVMARTGMTEEKWQAILKAQMSDAEKRKRADFILQTDQPMKALEDEVFDLYTKFKKLEKRMKGV